MNAQTNHLNRKRSGSKRQMSLKTTHYPILLLADDNKQKDESCLKWTAASDLPESCVGGSSWLIGGENPQNSTSHNFLLQSPTTMNVEKTGCSIAWSPSTDPHLNRKRGSAASDVVSSKTALTWAEDNVDAEDRYMLQPKYSQPNPTSTSAQGSKESRRNRKQQLWSLSPAAFHQSFDDRLRTCEDGALSNSCGNIDEQVRDHGQRKRRAGFCSGDTSKGAFGGVGYNTSGNDSAAGSTGTRPILGGRSPQSSFDSNGDVGQIAQNWMRMNGAIPSFKNILTSTTSNSPASQPKTQVQHGMTREQSGNKLAQAATVSTSPSTAIYGEFVKHKDSLIRPDSVKIYENGDQLSKKSLSLVLSEDLEAQKPYDETKTPLMKDKEKRGRLIVRQHLFAARRITSDYALFFSIFGILLMVFENELSAARFYEKGSMPSFLLKSAIMLSTIILIGLVIKFHVHEVQLFMNANSAEDWRIALTWRRCFQLVIELFACGICPIPVDLSFSWTTVHPDSIEMTTNKVPLDVVLSIPMFFRLYWICRVMLLHSRLFTDASSRSIAGLNRVSFNARFILKTLMTLAPGTMLLVFSASLWIIAAWILRLCERHHFGDQLNSHNRMAVKHQNYINSLWMIAITFLSVGYGDIVPVTFCGRAVAVITGVLGTCTSSMVVAVIARRLELTRAEKHVHNFMVDTQLSKELKHAASNVLRETWLIYKNRRLVNKIDPSKIRYHQRKFLVAIYALRKVKRDQRSLAENSVSLGDVAKTTSSTYELIHDIHSTQEGLALRMTAVEHQLSDIQRELSSLVDLIRSNQKRSSFSNSGYDPDHSPAESLRRRKHQPLVDIG